MNLHDLPHDWFTVPPDPTPPIFYTQLRKEYITNAPLERGVHNKYFIMSLLFDSRKYCFFSSILLFELIEIQLEPPLVRVSYSVCLTRMLDNTVSAVEMTLTYARISL